MQSKSNNKEFMPYENVNEVVDGLFESLLSRVMTFYQIII